MTPVVYQMFQFIKHNYKDEEFFKHSFWKLKTVAILVTVRNGTSNFGVCF
jgi:hypothetical protein